MTSLRFPRPDPSLALFLSLIALVAALANAAHAGAFTP